MLIESRYLDPYDRQNAAPTAWEIFQFQCRHPEVSANGYVTSQARPDYRTTLDDISASTVTAALRGDAETFCAEADESIIEEHLECFWD